jgi:hypothetical protein
LAKCIYKSFKFVKYQIGLLSLTFVSDKFFKFFIYYIAPISFKFVSNESYFLRTFKDLFDTNLKLEKSDTNVKLKGPIWYLKILKDLSDT